MPKPEAPPNLGHLIEGVVERDPLSDRYVIHTVDGRGRPLTVDVQDLLAMYLGKEVRFTLASFENLEKLAKLVEGKGGGRVMGIHPSELPVPFDIVRKS